MLDFLIILLIIKFFFYKTDDFQDDEKDERDKSSLPWASFNFINSIIGSGVIGKLIIKIFQKSTGFTR